MQKSRLPAGGENVFQRIKRVRREAEEKGVKIINLSIGQPTGPASEIARKAAAEWILSDRQEVHEYQDNGCLPCSDFAKRFVRFHMSAGISAELLNHAEFLPIPGIKPMLPLIPLACRASADQNMWVQTMTNPGYPPPATWANSLGYRHVSIRTHIKNQFIFDELGLQIVDLVMMNYPHNPSGQVSKHDWLCELCAYCERNNIRIFNDAAYARLVYGEHSCLAEVAWQFPNLSWAEAFSASKLGNLTGWRVGAMVGSPDFIGDIRTIKGNADSGFNAALAMGALALLENGKEEIEGLKRMYSSRLKLLSNTLRELGMKIALEPQAGFFLLCESPKHAFGQDVANAEEFNNLMIQKTGVMGVPFDPYIRYAVVGDVESDLREITLAFVEAKVSY
ncbi:MAG: aminotransferase class I/II-fold pyridoxal phosphate-dependent enzyme [Candidatus Paceibacterota bacterium]|jgi:LL-diaminopimelate aminotransferase